MSVLTDAVSLAKAGFKVGEIKELIELSKESATHADNKGTEGEKVTQNVNPAQTAPEVSAEPDYKKLYEDTKAELSKVQAENTKKEVEVEKVTIDSIVADLSKSLR